MPILKNNVIALCNVDTKLVTTLKYAFGTSRKFIGRKTLIVATENFFL